jgi:hypothetical protein
MAHQQHGAVSIFHLNYQPGTVALIVVMMVATIIAPTSSRAQTFTVIHSFQGPDGYVPSAGLVLDRAGNLYGTTRNGGSFDNGPFCQVYSEIGCGTVFKLSKHGTGWQLSSLFLFDGPDGAYPQTPVTIGPNGTVYGSTEVGARCAQSPYGCGVLFNLSPPARNPRRSSTPGRNFCCTCSPAITMEDRVPER